MPFPSPHRDRVPQRPQAAGDRADLRRLAGRVADGRDHDGPWPDVEETGEHLPGERAAEGAGRRGRARGAGPGRRFRDRGRRARRPPRPALGAVRRRGRDRRARTSDALIRALKGVPAGGRTARYRCVAAVAWPDGERDAGRGHLRGDARSRSPAGRGDSATTRSSSRRAGTGPWRSSRERRRTGSATGEGVPSAPRRLLGRG